jgi:ABC-type multidrug transport system fused ATPase/permease subunit
LIFIASLFVVINPIATAALLLMMLIIVTGLSLSVSARIRWEAKSVYSTNLELAESTYNLFALAKELRVSGMLDQWLLQLRATKRKNTFSFNKGVNLSQLPRYVVETVLIIGMVAFLVATAIWEQNSSDTGSISIFLAGGLRMIAALVPLQASLNSLKLSAINAIPSLQSLEGARMIQGVAGPAPQEIEQGQTGIICKDLTFISEDGTKLIDRVNLTIHPGDHVALVGSSGAGKTTLLELLLGFRQPTKGGVTVNGLGPETYASLHVGSIGYVPQRPALLHGTVLENLTLRGVSDRETIIGLLERCDLTETISSLNSGLETPLGPDKLLLSGGQVQRVGVARALLREPDFLFLDEATSALDSSTEANLLSTIFDRRTNRTVVFITHSQSVAKRADLIVYLEGGKIVDVGPYSSLASKHPDFMKASDALGSSGLENGS